MHAHAAEHEEKAQRILAHLKSHLRYDNGFMPRPFFIEFTGSPSSGKTSTIIKMYTFLRRLGFRVFKPQEGAEQIQHIPRTTPAYNVRTGLYALEMLLDEAHKHTYDIVLFDRCIFDAYVWMMYWRDKAKLSPTQQALVQGFFLFPLWSSYIDAAYFMICDADEALRRETRVSLSDRLGSTTNPETLRALATRYREAYEQLHSTHPQLELIDTTHLNEQQMVDAMGARILTALEAKIPATT